MVIHPVRQDCFQGRTNGVTPFECQLIRRNWNSEQNGRMQLRRPPSLRPCEFAESEISRVDAASLKPTSSSTAITTGPLPWRVSLPRLRHDSLESFRAVDRPRAPHSSPRSCSSASERELLAQVARTRRPTHQRLAVRAQAAKRLDCKKAATAAYTRATASVRNRLFAQVRARAGRTTERSDGRHLQSSPSSAHGRVRNSWRKMDGKGPLHPRPRRGRAFASTSSGRILSMQLSHAAMRVGSRGTPAADRLAACSDGQKARSRRPV